MPDPISRRRFLRDSAIVSGGVALVGAHPRAAGAIDPLRTSTTTSHGTFAQIEYGEPNDEFLVKWTRSGGSSSLQLTRTTVRFDVAIRGVEEVDLGDFERGRGQHEIVKHFGPAALDQLRNEVRTRRIFATP